MILNHNIERVSIAIINTQHNNLTLDFTTVANEKSISSSKNETGIDYNTSCELEERKNILSSQSKPKVTYFLLKNSLTLYLIGPRYEI